MIDDFLTGRDAARAAARGDDWDEPAPAAEQPVLDAYGHAPEGRVNQPVYEIETVTLQTADVQANAGEKWVAAFIGLCTAGPVGALASFTVLSAVKGKWFPWFLTGIFAAPLLIAIQLPAFTYITLQLMGIDPQELVNTDK